MNLKRLKDSLRYSPDRGFVYNSFKNENKKFWDAVVPFTTRNQISKSGNIYSLLKIKPLEEEYTKEGKRVKEEFSSKDLIEVIKSLEFNGIRQLFNDLNRQLSRVLEDWAPTLKELYNTDTITVAVRHIGSASELTEDFIETIPNQKAGGVTFIFQDAGGWSKGKNFKFLEDEYADFLRKKHPEYSEAQIRKAVNNGKSKIKSATVDGEIKVKKIPKRNTQLIEFVEGFLERNPDFDYPAIADMIVDDFVVTGASIKAANRDLNITDGSAIMVGLFRQ